ncbi:unnamed protein product [Cuscuta europaea]|uniref:RanBP2-type domain-containing protein n=1 Tax=Cuscuta europaea TaxID=41803 RepID=A0A9P0YKW0_CUSEU|nr:unnamed protein product [Cuscuta europaea]
MEGGNGVGGSGGGCREGDWECNGCGNRNYAFRSFCNRCKQPRLLVDNKTPPDSKWLPRIGDWICTGCTNNNYASRENCKKCGQPKAVASMPAMSIHGSTLTTHPNYFSGVQGGLLQSSIGFMGNGAVQHAPPLTSHWSSLAPGDHYGVQSASGWTLAGNNSSGVPYTAPNGWRHGDWICKCGFHNYSSRAQCKRCDASLPSSSSSSFGGQAVTALGTKRLASEELVRDWESKRLNAGHTPGMQPSYQGVQSVGSGGGMYSLHNNNIQLLPAAPTLLGKGAKQWRDGDWMCTNCNNHNYASRSQCNRCRTQRDVIAQSVSVA